MLFTYLDIKKQATYLWGQLHGSSAALAISEFASISQKPLLVIMPNNHSTLLMEEALHFYLSGSDNLPIYTFPDYETLIYDTFSPHEDIIAQRITALSKLPYLKQGIIVASGHTLMQRLPPKYYIQTHSFALTCKDTLDSKILADNLVQAGYQSVSQVYSPGEFAIRGGIIDLFAVGMANPLRIELFDNQIESLRTFNPETQRTLATIETFSILPAHEFPLTESAISLFRTQWRQHFTGNPLDCPNYNDVSQGNIFPGIEYYLPLFFEETHSLLDYLPEGTILFHPKGLHEDLEHFWQDTAKRYEQYKHDVSRPILPPEHIFLRPSELLQTINQWPHVKFQKEAVDVGTGKQNFPTTPTEKPENAEPLSLLNTLLQKNYRYLLVAESAGRREALLELLRKMNIHPKPVENWNAFRSSKENLCICIAHLEEGIHLPDHKLHVITEAELFGERVMRLRRRKKQEQDAHTVIRDLGELKVGDPVVHIDHGVGRYAGLQTLAVAGCQAEYVLLEYANNDKLYIPVSSLHLIYRYSGRDLSHAPLQKLGTEQWAKAKRKAAEKVRDVAAELLDIYARRAAKKGIAYTVTEDYKAFAKSFSYTETPDQEKAINAVLQDMQKPTPMDRLVCGDVGFGKTEVAMRAAFIAVSNHRQVAILVPTTLLAQQHYESFVNRFADTPIKVEVLSRFKTAKEQKDILALLAEGKIDIIIGTHKIIQPNIAYKDLGLVIIDEEHRFGVRDKERLKSLRAEVDILTLTATPIPRTLNMALASIRDLSIISTPPAKRLPIRTFVHTYEPGLVREAIMREILRGGQVFYLHNKVETIEKTCNDLKALIPEARLAIAHGQMHERDLEKVMLDFYHRKYNVLVCTTIIETGIDVPSANTIVVDRADKLGLSQLHQLRGRVGRSHHQAYAYLLIPHRQAITGDAEKRLDAISQFEELGAGFALASQDLEIRGAGELLGEGQSGNMEEIGFTLYMEMLDHAVKALQSGNPVDLEQSLDRGTEINLAIPALIPEAYLPDIHSRLRLYKRIANANHDELQELRVEMVDRFGLIPEATKNLFQITELKLIAQNLGIKKIEANQQSGIVEFDKKPKINPVRLIELIQKGGPNYKLVRSEKLYFPVSGNSVEERIKAIEALLQKIA